MRIRKAQVLESEAGRYGFSSCYGSLTAQSFTVKWRTAAPELRILGRPPRKVYVSYADVRRNADRSGIGLRSADQYMFLRACRRRASWQGSLCGTKTRVCGPGGSMRLTQQRENLGVFWVQIGVFGLGSPMAQIMNPARSEMSLFQRPYATGAETTFSPRRRRISHAGDETFRNGPMSVIHATRSESHLRPGRRSWNARRLAGKLPQTTDSIGASCQCTVR